MIKFFGFAFSFLVYAAGFIIWNGYLSQFGFFEYNFIQVRYISAGLLFWTPIILFCLLCYVAYWFLRKWKRLQLIIVILLVVGGVILAILYLNGGFSQLFRKTSQQWGGAYPIPVTLVGAPSQIEYLKNFGISSFPNAGKNGVQTIPVCLVYQNDDYFVFVVVLQDKLSGRAIALSRDAVLGLHQYGHNDAEEQCRFVAENWKISSRSYLNYSSISSLLQVVGFFLYATSLS